MKHPKLTAEIVTTNRSEVSKRNGDGWGDDAERTLVTGQVAEISIKKDGKLEFSFRITESGTIHFTDYQHRLYQQETVRHLTLTPEENWIDRP